MIRTEVCCILENVESHVVARKTLLLLAEDERRVVTIFDEGFLVETVHLRLRRLEELRLNRLVLLKESSSDGLIRIDIIIIIVDLLLILLLLMSVCVVVDAGKRSTSIVGVVEEASSVVQLDLGFGLSDLRGGTKHLVSVVHHGLGELLFVSSFEMRGSKIEHCFCCC